MRRWLVGLGLWAAACSSPEVQLVEAPEWPAPAEPGAFVGVFDADGALTVYPHAVGAVNPMPWVPARGRVRVVAGALSGPTSRPVWSTFAPGTTWFRGSGQPRDFYLNLDVWEWDSDDGWVSSIFGGYFAITAPPCPTFRAIAVGEDIEPSTTASRRLTVLTGRAVALAPDDWRAPPLPTHRLWTAEGLGSSVAGSSPLWSCPAAGTRMFTDGTGQAKVYLDSEPWAQASSPRVLEPPVDVTQLGPCVVLRRGWGALTLDGLGFVQLAADSQDASIRGANPRPDGRTTATALAAAADDTPVAFFPEGDGGRFAAYPADDRPLAPLELPRARGLVAVDGDLIAWGRDGGFARLVVERASELRWVERPTKLRGQLFSRVFGYQAGLLVLTTTGEVFWDTGGSICAAGRLPRALGTAVVEGVVVGDDLRLVVSEVVGNARRFEYYTLTRE